MSCNVIVMFAGCLTHISSLKDELIPILSVSLCHRKLSSCLWILSLLVMREQLSSTGPDLNVSS